MTLVRLLPVVLMAALPLAAARGDDFSTHVTTRSGV
jgi:hypothetical protein